MNDHIQKVLHCVNIYKRESIPLFCTEGMSWMMSDSTVEVIKLRSWTQLFNRLLAASGLQGSVTLSLCDKSVGVHGIVVDV